MNKSIFKQKGVIEITVWNQRDRKSVGSKLDVRSPMKTAKLTSKLLLAYTLSIKAPSYSVIVITHSYHYYFQYHHKLNDSYLLDLVSVCLPTTNCLSYFVNIRFLLFTQFSSQKWPYNGQDNVNNDIANLMRTTS